jgi:hypothetical protein
MLDRLSRSNRSTLDLAQPLKIALLDQSLDVAMAYVELAILGQGYGPVIESA